MANEAEARPEPVIVGRYALYGEIASGGMATVHFGRLLGPVGFSRPVAIKRLHRQLTKQDDVRAMFIDEARLVARIRHPNVVPTLDVVSDGGELLLVMEYVHGESLSLLARAARARHELIPIGVALAVTSNVLHGLHAAHEAKSETREPLDIVHRDVSPQNVLVGEDGIARMLDFGIARAAVRLESTREGVVKGKLAYMPPEQLAGGEVTRKADIYAAAVVLWELLTGGRLFHKQDGQALMLEKLLGGRVEPPSTHRPEVTPALDAIVLKGLSRDPDQRFASAREMAVAIEQAGPPAMASEVADWVESLVGERLAKRAAVLEDLERTSARMRLDARQVLAELDATAQGAADGTIDDAVAATGVIATGVAAGAPVTGSVPTTATLPPANGRRGPSHVVGAILALAASAAGALVVGHFISGARTGDGSLAAAPAGARTASVAATAPPPPTCPPGTIHVPGGRFFMGSDDGLPMEKPSHNVTLREYCIDTYEVTTADYKACSDRGECKRAGQTNEWDAIADHEREVFDPLCNVRAPAERAKHPINCVDWEMASIYCKSNGKRLPTEAEWEFAARGPDGRKYPWGDDEPGPQFLNACGAECMDWGKKNKVAETAMFTEDDGYTTTAPVGSFPRGASRYGVQDVAGNVWEWVADWYGVYPKEDQVDPEGPEKGTRRVIRGGAWNGSFAAWERPTFRYHDVPEKRSYGIGFRCAKGLL
jgi:serine/threonine-protein kinase